MVLVVVLVLVLALALALVLYAGHVRFVIKRFPSAARRTKVVSTTSVGRLIATIRAASWCYDVITCCSLASLVTFA